MRYREIQPCSQLRPIVESLWILEHDGECFAPQRVVPDGHPEIILNLAQPFEACRDGAWHGQPQCFFAGQIEGPLLLRAGGPARILGIRFHPHGAATLFGSTMHELTGSFTTIDDLSPALSQSLDRSIRSADPVRAVEDVLVRSMTRSKFHDPVVAEAVRRIMTRHGAVDLALLARELALSTRQLERRFHGSVGLTPKLFGRMQRFVQVFRVVGDEPDCWVDTAVACGYYDQSHLIRDFKSFSGETPSLLTEDAGLARHFLQRFGVSHSYNTSAHRAS